jgi:hypothetical protein
MNYKYPVILKYIILAIIIYAFIFHLKIMQNNQNLLLTIPIVFMFAAIDYVLIRDHPNLLQYEVEKMIPENCEEELEDDFEDELEDEL